MKRGAALALILLLAAVACERGRDDASPTRTPASSVAPSPTAASPRPVDEPAPGSGRPPAGPQRLVTGGTARVMAELCEVPPLLDAPADPTGKTAPEIAEVERQVAELRRLDWRRPVQARAIDDDEMDRLIEVAFEAQYPRAFYERRTAAWRTIGAIGPDEDLREALLSFGTGQVVGFYNPQNGELVYLGGGELTIVQKAVLAHELVHALDDQHFDLRRIDTLAAQCRDEEIAAALGAAEGSAQHFSSQVLLRYPAPLGADLIGSLIEAVAGLDAGVPPFVARLQTQPYVIGQAFVAALAGRGGVDEVNEALRRWPTTTEQVLHPERWPGDRPRPIDIPDLGRRLGDGWQDLDVMQVGELWLRELLSLGIDAERAAEAAAGWDGGAYRAWSDGVHVAVVLRTAWDTRADADAFAQAFVDWLDEGVQLGEVVPTRAGQVDVVFASDAGTMRRLVGPSSAAA